MLLGNITVPALVISSTAFPLVPDFPFGVKNTINVAVHQFGSLNAKVEQRFLLGAGGLEFSVRREVLSRANEATLKTFWLANNGPVGAFPFNAPKQNGTPDLYLCRFKGDVLSIDGLRGAVKSLKGLTLCQVVNYTHSGGTPGTWTWSPPSYSISATVTRFPAGGLAAALLEQEQTLFPLLKILPLDSSYPAIYLSDRDVTVGGQLYQARILKWAGIEQYMVGGPSSGNTGSDQAQFTLGNADRVLSALKNDVDLRLAVVEFSIFHVDSLTKIDFWKGQVDPEHGWECGMGDPEFQLFATDAFSELKANYPWRDIDRTCWKPWNLGPGQACNPPGTLNPSYPAATMASCDHGFKTANGCDAHNNTAQFGGIEERPQGVLIHINDQPISSVSVISDTVYGKGLPEIWCDVSPFLSDAAQGMPVTPAMIGYRDEKDYANGLGIIGAGPLAEFAHPSTSYASDFMDNQPFHGWSSEPSKLQPSMGLRLVAGNDPTSDMFALGESHNGAPSAYTVDQKAAGTAFVELRITKPAGFAPSSPDTHAMLITVRKGLKGFTWSGPGSRNALAVVSNPIWVAVNVALRTKGYFFASAAVQESLFVADAAVAAAAVCSITAAKIIGTGTETQFTFNGKISDRRTMRDWLEDILGCCLGYFWLDFGRLSFGIRDNASAVEAFNTSNILWNSLRLRPASTAFNRLTGNFGDVEFNFANNAVVYWDEDFAIYWGGNPQLPKVIPSEIKSPGVITKSQMGRVVTTRTREETGGIGTRCVKYHSDGSFKTTILALNVAPGMVCSMGGSDTMLDLPNYPVSVDSVDPAHAHFIKFRVNRLKLNPDYSIEVDFRTVHYDMYDLVNGPKPVDVLAPNPPSTDTFAPDNLIYSIVTDSEGTITVSDVQIGSNAALANRVTIEIYGFDGTESGASCEIHGAVAPSDLTITFAGKAPEVGYAVIDAGTSRQEIIYIESVSSFVATVSRGHLGTTAAAHAAVNTTIASVNALWPLDVVVGSGLNIAPGQRASNSTPAGKTYVSDYVPGSGLVRLSAPLGTSPAPAQSIHFYPLIQPLSVKSVMVPVPDGFFASGDLAAWSQDISLPCVGVVYAQVKATSAAGVDSPWFPTSFNPPMRTHGGTNMVLDSQQVPVGTRVAAFKPLYAPDTQDFFGSFCDIKNIVGVSNAPIATPIAATALTFSGLTATGSIVLTGTADATSQVQVSCGGAIIGGRRRGRVVKATTWVSDASLTTLALMAGALADWLNSDSVFSQYYAAAASGATISITDLTNNGGTLAVLVSHLSATTYTPSGFTSALGIQDGRAYAFAYEDSVDGWLGSLSAVSDSTGPTGSYANVVIGNIPVSPDSRIDFIHVYAFPNGLTGGASYRVGRFANSSADGSGFASFIDTQVEAGLTGLTAYPGSTQPSSASDLTLKVYRDGVEWFELHIPPSNSVSNICSTPAMRGLSKGALITGDVINNVGTCDIRWVLR